MDTHAAIVDTKCAAIIPVAGLSSRMGSFKPLLMLNGYPMIELTMQSALDGGASRVCVVTGREAEEVETALAHLGHKPTESVVECLDPPPPLEDPGIVFVHNAAYESSDMLESIKLGMHALLGADSTSTSVPQDNRQQPIFILPGDMPAVSPQTFAALKQRWAQTGASVVVPSYDKQQGHPLLVSPECFDAVLNYTGEGGLKQALARFEWCEVPVDDLGILMDADDPAAFKRLTTYIRKTRGVSVDIVEELFALYKTPSNVRAHTRAVAEVARRMALQLNAHGYAVDSQLCRAGGDLHDLNRLDPHHSEVAARNLQELGYDALAGVVAAHDKELQLHPRMFLEKNLVFAADKLVKESTLVSIERRYEGAFRRFPPSTPIGALIQKDSKSALMLLEEYAKITGDKALLQGTTNIIKGRRAPMPALYLDSAEATELLLPVSHVYTDLDGTLLAPGGRLLANHQGEPSLSLAKALVHLKSAGIEVILVTGRTAPSCTEIMRLTNLGQFIGEMGCIQQFGYGDNAQKSYLLGEWTTEHFDQDYDHTADMTPHEMIARSGALSALLKHYRGRLEVHTLKDARREVTFLLRGHIDAAPGGEAEQLLNEYELPLQILDNGVIHPRHHGLLDVDEVHVYHLMPKGTGKGEAVAADMAAKGLAPGQTLAIGDAAGDLAMGAHTGSFVLVDNKKGAALENFSKELLPEHLFVTTQPTADGWVEFAHALLKAQGH